MTRVRRTAAAPPPPATPPTLSQHRRDAELEAWICKTLRSRDLFAGVTDTATRAARLRVTLLQRKLVDSHAGRFGGQSISWREVFKRLYHEELTT